MTEPATATLTLNADGDFIYTPDAGYTGRDSFTTSSTTAIATSNVATVTITVIATNEPPVAQNDSYSTDEDTPLVVAAPGVLANDTDADGNPLTAVLVARTGPRLGDAERRTAASPTRRRRTTTGRTASPTRRTTARPTRTSRR